MTTFGDSALQASVNGFSVRDLIDARAREHPERSFLIDVDSGLELTFEQLQVDVRKVCNYLRLRGVEPGQSVAFAMHNGACCALTILGILYGGYRAVAVNLVAGRDVIAYVLSHSDAVLVLTQTEHEPLINEALSSPSFEADGHAVPVHSVSEYPDSASLEGSDASWQNAAATLSGTTAAVGAQAPVQSQSDALLMYTSGTTGRPKGVVLSHGNLIAGGLNVAMGHELTYEDRALCVLPLYHINGLCVTVFGPLVSAGSVVIPKRFSTTAFWQWVDQYRCSWFSVVPTQIAYLLRDAQSPVLRPAVRFARSASAPLSPDVHENFEKQFGIALIETMGLTETAAQITSNPMPPAARTLGSPGVPVGDEARIVSAELVDVPVGEEGELLIRGPNVMQRYYKNEEATSQALIPGGWLRTGDLARQNEAGFLFITGRLKELIIKGGENIAPREIDDALYQHADVVEAAAFARPCDDFGQRVEAAVTLKASSTLSEAELVQLCMERVGAFKCPDRIHFMDELPKGPSGKIQRQRLVELL